MTGHRMTVSRVIGALFLCGFLLYGVGSVLVTSVTGGSNFLSTISANKTILILGAFLILLNTAVDVGKAVLFFPILEKHGKRTALGYLATMIVEVVFLSLGALALLMIVPLGQHAAEGWAKSLGSLLVQSMSWCCHSGSSSRVSGPRPTVRMRETDWRSIRRKPWLSGAPVAIPLCAR